MLSAHSNRECRKARAKGWNNKHPRPGMISPTCAPTAVFICIRINEHQHAINHRLRINKPLVFQ